MSPRVCETGRLVSLTLVATALAAVPVWALRIVQDVNERCFGALGAAEMRMLYEARALSWGLAFVVTLPLLLLVLRLIRNRAAGRVLVGLFAVWKGGGLLANWLASPICWEPYPNEAPFWDEHWLAAVGQVAQVVGYLGFTGVLAALVLWHWGRFAIAAARR